ncbi:MAG TPA: thiamine pyrophosphate-binding protein [Streptosporangiaceae bacterium]|nr:thiamine pyrophosphate-binding protein [Streptosporangiaceae bacterium]
MLVSEAAGAVLTGLGAEMVFGVVGSGNFHVTNALIDHGARFVAARHEGGAACMADGWARATGKVGLLSVHQGPGLTNAMTGITEAAKSRTPLLVLAADVAGAAVRSNFRIDVAGLAASVGAEADRLYSPGSAAADLARAYRTAQVQRRTVVLAMPLDVQAAQCDAPVIPPSPPVVPARPAGESVAELAHALAGARRPVFVAGRGARVAGAREDLERLAEACGALLATSAAAKGLFRGNPWDLDVSGGFATPLAAELIGAADLIVGWGCSLNMWTMRHGRLIGPGATVAQVDDDVSAIGAHRPVDLAVLGDVGQTCRAVLAELCDRTVGGYRSPELRARIGREGRWRDVPYTDEGIPGAGAGGPGTGGHGPAADHDAPTADLDAPAADRDAPAADRDTGAARDAPAAVGDGPGEDGGGQAEDGEARIDPRTLTIALDDLLPTQRMVSVDSGNFMGYPSMFLSVPDASAFCFTQAYQSIGLGLASAIGAALAQPGRLPVAALGDGGALMGISELETVVRLRLPMVIVIYDDAAYGAEVHHFGPDRHPLDTVRFPPTDIAAIGRGFGCAGVTVHGPHDLAPVREWLAGPRDRPLVIDAKVTSGSGSWWLEEAFRGH